MNLMPTRPGASRLVATGRSASRRVADRFVDNRQPVPPLNTMHNPVSSGISDIHPVRHMATDDTTLRIDSVSLAFGGVAALRDVSMTVMPGEIRAVIGPNGAGKSSLLNVVTGVYRPQAGTVTLGGQVHSQVPTARLASLGVGRTFQNLALFDGLSVFDNIAAGCSFLGRAGLFEQLAGLGRARAEQTETLHRSRQAIAFFHLEDYAGQRAGTLPYGLQKRVELARAMVAHPHLLLLDEPMAGMVRADKQELTRYIRTLRDTYGTAIVLIEHDVGVVMDLSDRIAVLDHGRKIADGTPAEIAADQDVIDAYLGVAHEDAASSDAYLGVAHEDAASSDTLGAASSDAYLGVAHEDAASSDTLGAASSDQPALD